MQYRINCVMKLKEDIDMDQFYTKTKQLAPDLEFREVGSKAQEYAVCATSRETFERLGNTRLISQSIDSHPHWESVHKPKVPKELEEFVYEFELQNAYSFIKTEPTD